MHPIRIELHQSVHIGAQPAPDPVEVLRLHAELEARRDRLLTHFLILLRFPQVHPMLEQFIEPMHAIVQAEIDAGRPRPIQERVHA